jgi:hypothetical protein
VSRNLSRFKSIVSRNLSRFIWKGLQIQGKSSTNPIQDSHHCFTSKFEAAGGPGKFLGILIYRLFIVCGRRQGRQVVVGAVWMPIGQGVSGFLCARPS